MQKVNGVGCLGSSRLLAWGDCGCSEGLRDKQEGQDEAPGMSFSAWKKAHCGVLGWVQMCTRLCV